MHRKVNWNCDRLILWQQIANFKFSQKKCFSQIDHLSLSQNRIGEILSNQPEFRLKRFLVKRASFQIPGACGCTFFDFAKLLPFPQKVFVFIFQQFSSIKSHFFEKILGNYSYGCLKTRNLFIFQKEKNCHKIWPIYRLKMICLGI